MQKVFVFGYPGSATVTVTDDGVTIQRKGALNALNVGITGAKQIPFASITAVQYKEDGAVTSGYIQFSILGGREQLGGVFAATKDENSIMFAKKDRQNALELKRLVEDRIRAARTAQSSPPAKSAAEQIKEFKELLDIGAITQGEFDLKKKELLGF